MNPTQYKHIQKVAQHFLLINDMDVKDIVWNDMHKKYGDIWDKTFVMTAFKNTEVIPNVITLMKSLNLDLKHLNKQQFKHACKTFYKG